MKTRVIRALEIINESEFFYKRFKKEYPNLEVGIFWEIVKVDGLNTETQDRLLKIAPSCYNINGTICLFGEKINNIDLYRDGLRQDTLYELYDMTTEIKTGESYTFFISNLNLLEEATAEETQKVVEFLGW